MRDGIELQKRNVPTATLCHHTFEAAAHRQAEALGYGYLPLVVAPQAQSSDTLDDFRRRAEDILPAIIEAIVKAQPKVAT